MSNYSVHAGNSSEVVSIPTPIHPQSWAALYAVLRLTTFPQQKITAIKHEGELVWTVAWRDGGLHAQDVVLPSRR